MPLQIKFEAGQYRPVVICDHCGLEITDAEGGNYQWRVGRIGDPSDGPISFTHKQCCLAFEQTNGGRIGWCATPLECLPIYLANNLQLNWKRAKLAARMMAGC